MSVDSLLKTLRIRKRTLAERVNARVVSGYKPSGMAKVVVGKVSSKKFNEMMEKASNKYNETHEVKVFKDG